MKIRFLIDQNVSKKTALFLRDLGLDVTDVRDVGLRGKADEVIYNYARRNKLVIITFDHEFAYTFINKKDLIGLIIIRIHPQTLDAVNKTIENFFKKVKENDIEGKIIVVEKHRFRKRKVK